MHLMLKILGGQLRSRQLKTPKHDDVTRPWTGRARESVFNQLRGHIQGGNVLDLFAGVGTMGLEAVSRGAEHVVLVEQDRKIFEMLEQNVETLQCDDRAHAIQCDALSTIPLLRAQPPLDVVFVDPPYVMMKNDASRKRVLNHLTQLETILDDDGFVLLRTPINPEHVDHTVEEFVGPEIHKEGQGMWILFYGKAPKEPSA